MERSAVKLVGAAVLALVGLLTAAAGVVLAMTSDPFIGAVADLPGGVVGPVVVGGLAWNDGIRPGQEVVALTWEPAEAWELRTRVGDVVLATALAGHVANLRGAAVPAGLGLAGGLALVALVRRRPIFAAAGGAVASLAGGVALWATGDAWTSTVAGAEAVLVPAASVLLFWGLGRRVSVLAAIGTAIATAAWAAARLTVPDLFPAAEAIRVVCVIAAATLLAGLVVRELQRDVAPLADFPRPLDVLAAGAVGVALFLGTMAFRVPVTVALAVGVVVAVSYPRARAGLVRAMDRLVFADARARWRIDATEAEQGRVAREIHDAPLQVLAGVIRRLERVPGENEAATALREVADDLRRITTELHPPVLHDLGLAPALRSLVLKAAEGGSTVELELDNRTGYGAQERLPAEVELAAYRIVAEAVANAGKHAPGARVVVRGAASPDALDIAVEDDGPGLDGRFLRRAVGAGHMGMLSMRERADSIGAQLEIRGDRGTRVSLRWPRP